MMPLDAPDAAERSADVLSAALDELRSPLAVITGRAQLLRRHLQRDAMLRPEDCVATLALIERQVMEIEIRLRALQEAMPRSSTSLPK